MPDLKISEWEPADDLTGDEILPLVQGGQNRRSTVAEATASAGGLPAGGTTGQVLAKASNTNYDTTWVAGGGGTDYPQLTETTTARTLLLDDAGRFLYCTNAAGCAITVPPQSSVAWASNTTILGVGKLGNTTFVGGGGVSIIRPSDRELECYDGAPWALRRTAENEWLLTGYLVEIA